MNNFDKLYKSVSENIKIKDIENIKRDKNYNYTSPQVKSGFPAGEDGFDPENVEGFKTSVSRHNVDGEEEDSLTPLDLEAQIKELIANSYDPAITENEEDIEAAIKQFLSVIKQKSNT
jgi:hypothetical protein